MKKSLKLYFPHDLNSRSDRKLFKLFKEHKLAGIGAYWCIIEMLHEEGGYISLNEIENIAYELRVKSEFIQKVLNGFELFSSDSEKFWSESALKRINHKIEKSVKATESINNRWGNDTDVLRDKTERNTLNKSKVNERKDIVLKDFFDVSRKLYPGKTLGLDTEFKNFTKKHKDWKEIIPIMNEKISTQINERAAKIKNNQCVPEWKNFSTWINGRCWEEEPGVSHPSKFIKIQKPNGPNGAIV